MSYQKDDTVRIVVTDFKGQGVSVIDDVALGKINPVVLLRRNRSLAAIVPIEDEPADLWGAMRGSVAVAPGSDLTAGTGEVWDAEL